LFNYRFRKCISKLNTGQYFHSLIRLHGLMLN
jgi:hypothetical protein